MTPRPALLALILGLAAGTAAAQQGYNVRGEVRDGAFPTAPRFDTPLVTVSVKPATSDRFISGKNLDVRRQSGAFRFEDYIGGSAITNHWAIITVQAGENGEFVVPDPNASRAELT